jgi:two-component sensor histidine kinase
MVGVLLEAMLGERGRNLGNAAGVLGLVSMVLATIFALGYVYGSPLLYGGRALPIAATAALGALLLSFGTLAATGRDHWPQRAFVGDSAPARLLRAFVPLIVLVVIMSSIGDDIEGVRAHVNRALLSSAVAVVFAVLAVLMVARTARSIGETIDSAHLAQQRAERARAELAENLSNEIAHRVKNNLAMVAGLLQMQIANRSDGKIEVSVLREAVARIRAFAVLHERMYDAGAEVVELTDAVRRVAEVSREALAEAGVEISVVGERLLYPTKAAANVCLMVNELVTNGIKYGRAGAGGAVQIEVTLARQKRKLHITVWSSGNPIPPGFDVSAQRTMGLQVVTGIATTQYSGSFSIRPHHGGTLATVVLDDGELRQDAYAATA